MNLLISSVGRQNQLIQSFIAALHNDDLLFVADADINAAAMQCTPNCIQAPRYSHDSYSSWVCHTIKVRKIDFWITLSVDELGYLIKIRSLMAQGGCQLIGASTATLDIGRDKVKTRDFCLETGLCYPEIYMEKFSSVQSGLHLPLILKERCGKGSRGIVIVNSIEELIQCHAQLPNPSEYILQDYIEGVEFGADIVCDFNGEYITTFCRRKTRMRNGETDIAESENHPLVLDAGEKIGRALRCPGSIDADFMLHDNKLYLLDLNLRFGGGYMFSHNAGANLPAVFVAWMKGTDVCDVWLQPAPGVRSHRIEGQVIKDEKHDVT